MQLANLARWGMGLALALMLLAVPYVYYRHSYTHARRLRPVEEGKLYRSGCLTAAGLRDAIATYKIRTVINLMEENTDPALRASYFDPRTTRESEVCREMGADLVVLKVELVPPNRAGKENPPTAAAFLKIMDDPRRLPALLHCKAGLHRTGCLSAVYRMEYQGWDRLEALRELKAHGFGEFASTSANAYIVQYLLAYEPTHRRSERHPPVVLTSTPKNTDRP